MKKVAYIAVFAGMAPAIMGAIVPGAANAATTTARPASTGTQAKTVSIHPVAAAAGDYTCHGSPLTSERYCSAPIDHKTTFYFRSGGAATFSPGTVVRVTCWYKGNTGYASDPYWDHITEASGVPLTGHVADRWVNFGGEFPFSWPGPALSKCG
jgi:hypothetical protein